MKHEPLEHEEWEQELKEAALAVCDLFGFAMVDPLEHPRLCYWVGRLRAVAWKRNHITEFGLAEQEKQKGQP